MTDTFKEVATDDKKTFAYHIFVKVLVSRTKKKNNQNLTIKNSNTQF